MIVCTAAALGGNWGGEMGSIGMRKGTGNKELQCLELTSSIGCSNGSLIKFLKDFCLVTVLRLIWLECVCQHKQVVNYFTSSHL